MLSSQALSLSQEEGSYSRTVRQLTTLRLSGYAVAYWSKLAQKSTNRYRRLQELVKTEKEYHSDLLTLSRRVKGPLLEAQLITVGEGEKMFANLDGMIDLSGQMLAEFLGILNCWDRRRTMIGQAMAKYSRFLIIYNQYLINLAQTQRTVRHLLEERPEAKAIERDLSTQHKVVQISDLIIKPFQRPLKYQLLLKDYHQKTDSRHPDYTYLKEAISCFQRVNQQNNLSIDHKEKLHTLVQLDARYGNIIEGAARFYIDQFEARYLGRRVTVYLFSDLAVLAQTQRQQFMRVRLSKYSRVESAGSYKVFQNCLFLYGKKVCVHLTFLSVILRDQALYKLETAINSIISNESHRQKIIRMHSKQRFSDPSNTNRNIDPDSEPQIDRPLVATVLGMETRELNKGQFKVYYAVQFSPIKNEDHAYVPKHTSLLEEETLNQLEAIIRTLYPDKLRCPPINSIPKQILSLFQYRKRIQERMEVKIVLIQLLLNSLFRNDQILKKIDFVMHMLKISQPLWEMLKKSRGDCHCHMCLSHSRIVTPEHYFKQIEERERQLIGLKNRGQKVHFCDMRTLEAHRQFVSLYPEMFSKSKSQDRVVWVKRKLGKINHNLVTTRPRSNFSVTNITVTMRLFPKMKRVEVSCLLNHRIQNIIHLLQYQLTMNLSDYVLVAQVNGSRIVLRDDEVIGNFLKISSGQQGCFSKIFTRCCSKSQYDPQEATFCLQKYWVIFEKNDYLKKTESRRKKTSHEVDSVMARMAISGEIRVSLSQTAQLYALYLFKQYFQEFKAFSDQDIVKKLNDKSVVYIPSRWNTKKMQDQIIKEAQRLKKDRLIREELDVSIQILQRVKDKPGWSCLMYQATLWVGINSPEEVQVGCDIRGVRVRALQAAELLLEFRIQDDGWIHHMCGQTLVIARASKEYHFKGSQTWKVSRQIQFYRLYTESFRLVTLSLML